MSNVFSKNSVVKRSVATLHCCCLLLAYQRGTTAFSLSTVAREITSSFAFSYEIMYVLVKKRQGQQHRVAKKGSRLK
jgi:hypothetical protein